MLRAVLIGAALAAAGLAATNPDEKRLRDAMRSQDSLMLEAAAFLPIKRENFGLLSRFEISWGFGKQTCWGAAYTVFLCPPAERGGDGRKG